MPLPITRGALSAIGFGLFSAPAALAADPYFNYVTMLLHGDGTNGAQNNTFLDSSTNNFTITRNGNTTQGTFSPYGSNWSNYFDGSGDYLTLPSNAAFTFGTGDFTVEGWIYISAYGVVNSTGIFQQGTSSFPSTTVNTVAAGVDQTGKWAIYAKNTVAFSVATVSTGAWVHFALVRSGTTTSLYANGTSVITVSADSTNYTGTFFGIGSFYGTSETNWNGYISNLRVVKGTAVYTSAFTPPTAPLTAITNTSLLACQSNRFIDNSTNNFAITRNGDTSVQRFSPFSPSAAYSTSTIGGSGYFDGTGDYLSVPNSSNFSMGSGNFTCEFWVYVPSNPSVNYPSIVGPQSVANYGIGVRYGNTGYANKFTVHLYGTGSWVGDPLLASSSTYPLSAWHHVAVTRSGTTMTLWVNGASAASTTSSANVDFSSNGQALWIGDSFDGASGYFNGYISDLRIVKGTAVYTSAFTPPTAPLTAIANTSLLTNFTNGGIFDNAMMNNLETVGNAQISTSVFKYGTGSMAFDGSGDCVSITGNPNLTFGTGDFTIEMWINSGANGTSTRTMGNGAGGSWSSGKWVIATSTPSNPNKFIFAFWNYNSGSGDALVSTVTANDNAWHHYAVTRSGSTLRLFIDGNLQQTITSSASIDNGTPAAITVGRSNFSADADWAGYIDDLRITKGYARYTANFTPPAAAFPNQ